MNATDVLKALEPLADPQTRKTYLRHGCPEPVFGVKIARMKELIKRLKLRGNTALARDLFRSGNGDAMYLAGLIVHGGELTRKDLNRWVQQADWSMISQFTVPWTAAEHPEGWTIALEWIDSPRDSVAAAGWMTLVNLVSCRPDESLDLKTLGKLLDRVAKSIHKAPNQTRYAMNQFVIGVGCFVEPLSKKAVATAESIGPVEVDMGDTACRVPVAAEYIAKVVRMGRVGRKRAQVKCA